MTNFPIPDIPSEILTFLKIFKIIEIELTLVDYKGIDLACLWTKLNFHIPDDKENSGMRVAQIFCSTRRLVEDFLLDV